MKKYLLFESLSGSLSKNASKTQSFKGAAKPSRSSGWKHLALLFMFMLTMLGSYAQTSGTPYTTTGNGTWTCPAGVTSVTVQCWGGGGAGGGGAYLASTYSYEVGGGGAGGSYISYTVSVTPGNVYNFTVGAGGTGVAGTSSTAGNGNAGGSTFFGNSTAGVSSDAVVLATGGAGGNGAMGLGTSTNKVATNATAVSGSTSGNVPSSGYISNIAGGNGSAATGGTSPASGAGGTGANGGGAGGAAVSGFPGSTTAGSAGTAPGGGGSGANNKTAAGTGGAGGKGQIELTWSVPATAPTTQASAIAFSGVGSTGMTVGATRGNGSNVAIFMSASSGAITNPTNGTAYTANAALGSGTQLGTSGYYCIYNGSSATPSVAVTGLSASTTYYVQAFEYNGSTTTCGYNTSTATGNPNSQATSGGAAPVINSSLSNLVAYVGTAISTYTITATNSPTSYNATGLPTGLSVNTGNGQITGTPSSGTSGYYAVTISASNGSAGSATLPIYVLDVPTTTSISPTTTAVIASGNYSITVNGTNFVSGYSNVTVGGSTTGVTTTYVSATQLTATITAATITGTSATIGVTNTGVSTTSNTQSLTITVPTPTITSLSPTSSIVSGGAFTLTVNGTNFISGVSTVKWNGSARTTTYVSATQLTASILAGDVTTTGSYPVTVSNSYSGTTNTSGSSNYTVSGTVVSTFNSTTNTDLTWICPTGVTSVTIEAWGGGGAGGGGNYTTPIQCNAGGGGGGGSYVQYTISVTPGTTYYYYVGAGGAGTAAANGGNGTFSYFGTVAVGSSSLSTLQAAGTTLLIATGGTGGTAGAGNGTYVSTNNAAGNIFIGGSAGGTSSTTGNIPSTGAVTYAGTAGVASTGGTSNGTAGSAGYTGAGGAGAGASGSAGGGAGGAALVNSGSSTAGTAGTIPGGGGSGGTSSHSSKAGGAGASGQIQITYGVTPSAQPTSLVFTGTNGAGTTATWTKGAGTGDNSLVVAYPTGSTVTAPSTGTTYSANAAYGSGSALGLGYVVYAGSSNSVAITGMSGATTYDIYVYSYNGYNIYLTTSPLTNSVTTANTPVISSALTASGVVGTAFSYTITASFSPTSYTATGSFPPGVSQTGTTSTISGTPTAAGTYTVAISATNSAGGGLSKNLVITILDVPTTTSISPTSTPIISSGNYSITVNGTNFVSGGNSSVTVNGSTTGVTTTYVSATQLTATITAATIGSSTSATIGVTNTGVSTASNTQTLSITVGNPATFTATPHTGSLTQIDLTATADGFSDNIAVVTSTTSSFTTPSGNPSTVGLGNAFAGGTLLYYGPASGLASNPNTGLTGGTTYYYKAFSYDGSFNYSTGFAISQSTNHSYLVNTDFTGLSANFFSSTIVTSSTINVAQDYGSGILGDAYVSGAAGTTGYALGTVTSGSSAGVLAIGSGTNIANANALGMYMDFKVSATAGNSLNVSSISGQVHQSGTATVNTFGVYYGVGTATTAPATFYNANGTDGLAGAGTAMAATTESFNSSVVGSLTGVSNIQGTSVLYVRVIVWRNYPIGSNSGASFYVSGLTIGGSTSAAVAPSSQPTNLVLTSIDASHFSVSWNNNVVDAGSNSLVVMYPHGATHADPTNNTSYSASTTYSSGGAIGNGYVLYNGSGTSITSVDATSSGDYDIDVYSFNTNGSSSYLYNVTSPLKSELSVSNIQFSGTPGAATQGTAYHYQVTTNQAGCTYSLYNSTTLPAGLTMNSSGLISGTPTGYSTPPSFQVEASYGGAYAITTYTITVNPVTTYYYYNSTGTSALDNYASWWSSPNGQGFNAPTSAIFTTQTGLTFVVQNTATTANNSSSSWSIGTGNILTVNGTGVTLTIDGSHAISTAGTVDLVGASTLNILNTTVPSLESILPTTSTVIYGSTAAAQTIAPVQYGNLTISNTYTAGGGASTSANTTIFVTNLTVTAGATLTAITGTSINTYISVSGAAIINGNYVFPANSTKNYITGAGSFTVGRTGVITVGDLAGIASSTSSGNIRTTIASRSLSSGSYVYDASGAAAIGAGLTGCNNLTISNASGTTTISAALAVTGTLTVSAGTLATGGFLTLKSTSITNSAVVADVCSTCAITGNATVERYIPSTWRSFRDLGAAGVYASGNTLYNTWQESGSYSHSGYGLFITGATSTAGTTHSSNHVDNGSGGTYLDYSLNSYPSAYSWNTAKQSFDTIKNTNTTSLNPYQSYRVLVRGDRGFDLYTSQVLNYPNGLRMYDATALRTTGSLIYGNVTYSSTGVTNSVTGSAYTFSTYGLSSAASGYSYITNPYDCPIDFHNIYSNGRITNMIYGYWYIDPTVGATGGYVAYNAVANTTNLGYSNGNFIQAGQGFLVANYHVDGTHLPSIQITEADKSIASSSRTSIFGTEAPASRLFVGLLKNATRIDGVAVVFGNNFSNGIGLEDSRKLSSSTDNLSIKEGSNYLSIDGRLPATSSDVLSLQIAQPSTTAYQLRVDASEYINEGFVPYLLDSYKNTTTALSTVDTINFTVDASTAASYANRFSIIFQPSALAVNSIVASATLNNKIATITWNTVGEKGESRFEVEKSTDGKNFASIGKQAAKNTSTASYTATDNSVAEGSNYYRIKAVSGTGAVNYSNIAKLTTNNLQLITVYPNPLVGKTLNVSLSNVATGKYVVSIYNVLGEKVAEQSIAHSGGSATHAITINNTLARGIYSVTIREASSNQIVHQTSISVQP